MCSKALILVALALLACGSAAAGTGRPLLQVTSSSASSRAVASSTGGGGPVTAVSMSTARDGATVNTETVVTSSGGGPVTGITVAEGTGDVVIDRRTAIDAAGEEAKGTVAVFVKKVADGSTKGAIEQELVLILGEAEPFVFVRTLALSLLESGAVREAAISAAESLLKDRGCEAFKRPFIGFTTPIARVEGGCSPVVNECIFEKCPSACCSDGAKANKTCGCTGSTCDWEKAGFSKAKISPFFWKCKDCQAPADSCICA